MTFIERMADARGSLEGKVVAVILAVALVFGFINVNAFAEIAEQITGEPKTEETQEQKTIALLGKSADQQEPPAAESEPPAAPQPEIKTSDPKSENVVENGVAQVTVELEHAFITYASQHIGIPADYFNAPLQEDLVFQAEPDEGYANVKVQTIIDGQMTTLQPESDGSYKIAGDKVTSKLTIKVTAEATDGAKSGSKTESIDTKREYKYEDDKIEATATLTDPTAIPDNAEFKVTPITRQTPGFNMDAYLKALNDKLGSESFTYTEENTLLYDISFILEEKEIEPAEGKVVVDIKFKQQQLTNELGITEADASKVQINHLSVDQNVLEQAGTTQAATNVTANEIKVETVSDQDKSVTANAGNQEMKVELSSLSVIAATSGSSEYKPGTTRSFADILGGAANIGVVANVVTLAGHLETNIATKELKGNSGPWAGPRNSASAGKSYIASFTGTSGLMIDAGSGGNDKSAQYVYTTPEAAAKFGDNTVIMNPDGTIKEYKRTGFVLDFSMSQTEMNNLVDKLIGDVKTNSEKCFEEANAFDFSTLADKTTIDIRGKGAGTFYINFDNGEFSSLENIKLDQNQTIVFNIPDTSVSFPQMNVTITGLFDNRATDAGEAESKIAEQVIYNCPNATYAHSTKATTGTFIVPNATYDNDSVAAGWLVANNITKIGGQEWHSIYPDMPDPFVNASGSIDLGGTKTVANRDFKSGDSIKFTLTVPTGAPTPVDADGAEVTEVTINPTSGSSAAAAFGKLNFTQANAGTYTYTVTETATMDGVSTDAKTYDVVVKAVDNKDGSITVTMEDADGNSITGFSFVNTYNASGSIDLGGKKVLVGRDLTEGEFSFKLYKGQYTKDNPPTGEALQTKSNAADGTVAFDTISYTLDDMDKDASGKAVDTDVYYTVVEVAGTDGTVIYTDSLEVITVTLHDEGDGTITATADKTIAGNNPATFTNTLSSVNFSKTEVSDTAELAGATLAILDKDGNAIQGIPSWQSDGKAPHVVEGQLNVNTVYQFVETSSPDGYTVAEKIYFTIDSKGNVSISATGEEGSFSPVENKTVRMEDAKTKVNFSKQSIGGGGELPGAALQIFEADGTTPVVDKEGNELKWVSSDKPHTIEGILSVGIEYMLTETTAPNGYIVAESIVFRIENNGDVMVKGKDKETGADTWTKVEKNTVVMIDDYDTGGLSLGFRALAAGSDDNRVTVYPLVKKIVEINKVASVPQAGAYSFTLTGEGTELTGTNDVNGEVAFYRNGEKGLTYTKNDAGQTFTYVITEDNGGSTIKGITYDNSQIILTVKVEEQNGKLVAKEEYKKEVTSSEFEVKGAESNITFKNIPGYEIKVQKTTRGTEPKQGLEGSTYGLWMYGEGVTDDVLIDEQVSDKDGWITFKGIYPEPGKKYFFKEVEAPMGHKVDPYRTGFFTIEEGPDGLILTPTTK